MPQKVGNLLNSWNFINLSEPFMRNLKFITYLLIAASTALIIYDYGYAWDDSAITLGFSKTLALFGKIAPGQFSDPVEGFSTLSWMFLNSFFFFLGFKPEQVFFIAKTLSFILNFINLYLFYKILRHFISNEIIRFFGIIILVFSRVFIFESLNGMETPLYLLLIQSSFLIYIKKNKTKIDNILFTVSGAVIIFTRFEGIWFLLPFLICDIRKYKWKISGFNYYYIWIAVFIALEIFRFSYFGELVPNTITAKTKIAYNVENFWLSRLLPFWSLFKSYLPLILIFPYYFYQYGIKKRIVDFSGMSMAILFVCCGVIFNFIVGKSFGPSDRMFYSVIPFIILILIYPWDKSGKVISSKETWILALAILLFTGINIYSFEKSKSVPVYEIKQIADDLANINSTLKSDRLVYAGADMGGLLLFGEKLRVIDIGLLCNRRLAHSGYSDLGKYLFDEEKPDIIKVNFVWFFFNGIKNSDDFYIRYAPVIIGNYIYYIRSDRAEILEKAGRIKPFSGELQELINKGEIFPEDIESLKRFGKIQVLIDTEYK